MTNEKNLNYTGKEFTQPNVPKTYERFILEQSLTDQQDLYPDLGYEDISSHVILLHPWKTGWLAATGIFKRNR